MRNPNFFICENKDTFHLFAFVFSGTILLLPKTKISSLQPYSVAVQSGLCRTWSEITKTGFLTKSIIDN